jgi:hypothetical protein
MFLKDPETGKRSPVARPKDDWVADDRPDLAIVDGELWARVQARLQAVREAYAATTQHKRPRGQAPEVYSPHLLSGLMRCAICGARISRAKISQRSWQSSLPNVASPPQPDHATRIRHGNCESQY